MNEHSACRKARRRQERLEKDMLLDDDDRAEQKFGRGISPWAKAGIALALVGIVTASFSVGKYPIAPDELIRTIANSIFDPAAVDPQTQAALFNIRLPRILVVVMVGAALAAAGAAYQGMFRNPLVSPDLLGASAGASLGACLALVLDLPSTGVQAFAFVGGMAAVGCVVWLNRIIRYDEPVSYTHLAVYKRQGFIRACFCLHAQRIRTDKVEFREKDPGTKRLAP